jgi:hypothetical protein
LQRFLADIGKKPIAHQCRHRETDAINGHAVPKLKGREWSAATHDETTAAALNSTNTLHQTREHAAPSACVHWS